METFGQKLRQAVESQGLRLDEVAEATGLAIEHIQALEHDDFAALPDDEIVCEALRSFARLLEVDPDEVIADYRRERQRWLAAVPAELEVVEVRDTGDGPEGIESPLWLDEPQVSAESSRPRLGRTGGLVILASAILALAVAVLIFRSRPSTAPESRRPAVARDAAPMKGLGKETQGAVSPTVRAVPPPDSMKTEGIEQPTGASELSILEHGVGRGVVHRQLVGESERFAEGDRVWFWTMIEGGTAGKSIEHVWLHDGTEALRVRLKLGGGRWRTQSYKDLNPGSAGTWAVEARDEAGRVLARRGFLCSAGL